jgi:2-(1,2-epoxy-1,2-dihydrophenyl)acetyl-CoA isomerase
MAYSKIKVAIREGVATVTLNDPTKLNAASPLMLEEAAEAFAGFTRPGSGVRCVVLTGEGKAFCSGFDMTAAGDVIFDGKAKATMTSGAPSLPSLMRNSPLPIVTAVNGVAAGVGCSFALMGDLVVAGESAYFLQAFRRRGLVPDGGATYVLSRLAGKARAMELTLLGERLPARTALEWGMINRCVADDEVLDTAWALAKNLADGPMSLSLIRKLIWDGLDASWDEALANEAHAQGVASSSEDCHEGVTAFLEKRPAVFVGR